MVPQHPTNICRWNKNLSRSRNQTHASCVSAEHPPTTSLRPVLKISRRFWYPRYRILVWDQDMYQECWMFIFFQNHKSKTPLPFYWRNPAMRSTRLNTPHATLTANNICNINYSSPVMLENRHSGGIGIKQYSYLLMRPLRLTAWWFHFGVVFWTLFITPKRTGKKWSAFGCKGRRFKSRSDQWVHSEI